MQAMAQSLEDRLHERKPATTSQMAWHEIVRSLLRFRFDDLREFARRFESDRWAIEQLHGYSLLRLQCRKKVLCCVETRIRNQLADTWSGDVLLPRSLSLCRSHRGCFFVLASGMRLSCQAPASHCAICEFVGRFGS